MNRLLRTLPLAALLLAGAACSDDADVASTATTAGATDATDPPTTTTGATDGGDAGDAGPVEITAVDYAFEGVPDSVPAGTQLTLVNDSDAEIHEIVAIHFPDDETRPFEELTGDPSVLGPLLGAGIPAAVIVATPGSSTPGAVLGDGTLTEPGRYLLVCTIPTGVDPDAYLAAAAAAQGGPPEIEGGPPHFINGMVAEITVE